MSENIQFIFEPRIKKLYGKHLKKIDLEWVKNDKNEANNADVTITILVDMSDKEIEQCSESLSVICSDMLISNSIWVNPVIKNIKQKKNRYI